MGRRSRERGTTESEEAPKRRGKAKAKRPLSRRILRGVGIALAVPVVLVLLVVLYLHTGSGQNLLRERIEQRLGERVNGTVTLGGFDFALFGSIGLRELSIRDGAGEEAIALASLEVRPDWRALLGGEVALDAVTLDGLNVHVIQYEDGTSNLKALFKPSPPSKKPHVVVRALSVAKVGVKLDKPDGTTIDVSDVEVAASLDVAPEDKRFLVDVTRIAAGLTLHKPADGLLLAVTDFSTGVRADLDAGVGTVALLPTKAHVRLDKDGAPTREVDLALDGVTVGLGDGELDAALSKLLVGALVLESLDVEGKVADGALSGDQSVDLVGLHLDHERLNGLLGKELLATDVDLRTKLAGPPGKLVLDTLIDAGDAQITLKGAADLRDRGAPGFDVSLVATGLDTDKLLAKAVPLSKPIKNERLELSVVGTGSSKETLSADLGLDVTNTTIGAITVDRVHLEARIDKGVLTVKTLTVEALDQKLLLAGEVGIADKHVDATVTLDGDVGVALAKAREAGLPVTAQLPAGALRLPEGAIAVHAKGQLDGALEVTVHAPEVALAGGRVSIETRANLVRHPDAGPDEKKVEVTRIEGGVRLSGVSANTLAALRGKAINDFDARVSGQIDFEGTVEDPRAKFGLSVDARAKETRSGKGPPIRLSLRGEGSKQGVHAKVVATAGGEGGASPMTLATVDAHVPLSVTADHKGLAMYAPLSVVVDLPNRKLSELTPLLPARLLEGKKLPSEAEVSLRADVGGTAAHPKGTFGLDLRADALGGVTQRVLVDGHIDPDGRQTVVAATAKVWLDDSAAETVVLDGGATLSRSPFLPGPKGVEWRADLDLRPQHLDQLPVSSDKLAGVRGEVSAHLALHGSQSDVLGTIAVHAKDVHKGEMGPLGLDLDVALGDQATRVDVDAKLADASLLSVRGDVGLAGKGLIPALKAGRHKEAPLDLRLEVPRRTLASLSALRPKLAELPGELSGAISIQGTVADPRAGGDLGVDGFDTLTGEKGRVGVHVDATAAEPIDLVVGLGPEGVSPPPVAIRAHVERHDIASLRGGGELPIAIEAKASGVDVRRLVPAFAVKGHDVIAKGTLDWDMSGEITLGKTEAGTKLVDGGLDGKLALANGQVSIPGSSRTYDDVTLALTADRRALHITSLSMRESDRERSNRRLDLAGQMAWDKLRPTGLDLTLSADEWLVFGGELGHTDAPRGALSIDASVKGLLDRPVKRMDVEVHALTLLVPDRYERAHQPEDTDVGDVFVVGEAVEVGKLPVPESVKAAALAAAKPEPEPAPVDPSVPETGMDIYVSIPKKVHILKSPMDLWPVGTIAVHVRPQGRKIEGRLVMVDGELSLGGKMHKLEEGAIFFDEKCPKGCLDLHFVRHMKETVLRDVSLASGTDAIHIRMTGPLSDRKTVLSGAASPGTLFDLLSAHNVGRPRYVSAPDMPASATVQYPQYDNLLMLSYFSVNLPHLLFMDRVAGWADPYDDRSSYGHMQHYELERTAADGATRVRAIERPRGAGQSEAEVQLDWLWNHPESRAKFGVGVTGGSRAGGGPGLFFEWSSED